MNYPITEKVAMAVRAARSVGEKGLVERETIPSFGGFRRKTLDAAVKSGLMYRIGVRYFAVPPSQQGE